MADPVVAGLTVTLEEAVGAARDHAATSADAGRLDPEVVDAIGRAGLFKLHLPTDLGGPALPLPDALDVISRVAEADGAAGWAVMIGAGPAFFAGTMPAGLATEVFGEPTSVVAGSGHLGRAEPDGDGWRVSGRWRWCSGAPWATWFTFGACEPGGEPFAIAVPAADVRRHPDTWAVRGLAATASWDAELEAVRVPRAHAFPLGTPPRQPQRLFQVPFAAFAECTMAAVTTGLARHLEHALVGLLAGKPARTGGAVGDDAVVRHRVARLVAGTRAGAAYLAAAVDRLWAHPTNAEAALDLALAATHVVATGRAAGAEAADLAGMSALPLDATLGRVVADLQAVGHNAVVASARFTDAGATLLERGRG